MRYLASIGYLVIVVLAVGMMGFARQPSEGPEFDDCKKVAWDAYKAEYGAFHALTDVVPEGFANWGELLQAKVFSSEGSYCLCAADFKTTHPSAEDYYGRFGCTV